MSSGVGNTDAGGNIFQLWPVVPARGPACGDGGTPGPRRGGPGVAPSEAAAAQELRLVADDRHRGLGALRVGGGLAVRSLDRAVLADDDEVVDVAERRVAGEERR